MGPENSTEKSIGAIEANIKNLGNNMNLLSKDVREYSKENKEAHIRIYTKIDDLGDDLTTSETDFNIAMTKLTDTVRIAQKDTTDAVGDLERDSVWLGRIWKGVCAFLIPVVIYIVIQLLDHVGG